MNKKWSDEETRWLKANFGRMDLQNLSHKLGCSLSEIEKKVKLLRLVAPEPAATRKTPATLKEAVREISAARRDYEKAIELFHKRKLEDAGRHFEDLIEKHRLGRPRPHVLGAYLGSHERFADLYKKLAE